MLAVEASGPESILGCMKKVGIVVHACCHPSTGEKEAGGMPGAHWPASLSFKKALAPSDRP